MRKKKPKARRWKCQGRLDLGRCKNYALIETDTTLRGPEFGFRIVVKLCMPCSMKFNAMFPRLTDTKRVAE